MIVTKHFQEMKIFVIVNKHLMEGHPEHIGNFKAIKKFVKIELKLIFPYSMDFCHYLGSNVSSHTGLEYQSQALSQIGDDQAFCIFCDNDKMHQLLCERKHVVSHNQRLEEGFRMQYKMESEDEDFSHQESAFLPLTSVYCKDTSDILNTENLDLLCPLLAMEHMDALPIVKSYLSHIMLKFNLAEFVQHPNNALILTMPTKLPHKMKESLLKYFFEEAKAARVCLLPKPLAIGELQKSYIFPLNRNVCFESTWYIVISRENLLF